VTEHVRTEDPTGEQGAHAAGEEAVRTFRELDLNQDGRISEQEFLSAMAARGEEITDAELRSIFADADADADRDGHISLAEFTAAWNRAG
jgi:Ca2+-binding EF-hand superfamily protein